MRFPFTKEAMPDVPDATLDAIAAEAEGIRAALFERERRAEARRQAEAQAALDVLAEQRRTAIDAATKRHADIGEKLRAAHQGLGAAIVATGAALDRRDSLLRAAWRVESELRALAARVPALDLGPFSREACGAARRLAPVIERELFVDPLRNLRAENPGAFFSR